MLPVAVRPKNFYWTVKTIGAVFSLFSKFYWKNAVCI